MMIDYILSRLEHEPGCAYMDRRRLYYYPCDCRRAEAEKWLRDMVRERDEAYVEPLSEWPECLGFDPDVQDQLSRLGLIAPREVTEATLEECSNPACPCEVGDACYHLTEKATAAFTRLEGDQ